MASSPWTRRPDVAAAGLHLTPKGESVIQRGFPVWRDAQTRTIRVLGPESRSTLDDLLAQAEKLAAA